MKIVRELYQYRELLKTNVKKDIRGKYKGSFLGVLWSFINPLLMVTVYAIVFPYILRSTEDNFLIFLIVAIIPWNFFTTVVGQGTPSIVGNQNIIKKVYFPRIIIPISAVTSGLVNFFISCLIIFAFLIGSGVGLTWYLIFIPVIALIQYIFCLGLVLILSAIDVYIRDTEYIVNFVIMLAFYATPILYNLSQFDFPKSIQLVLTLNPMTHIINGFRDVMYYQQMPDWGALGIVAVGSTILLIVGYFVFQKLQKGFAEEL